MTCPVQIAALQRGIEPVLGFGVLAIGIREFRHKMGFVAPFAPGLGKVGSDRAR